MALVKEYERRMWYFIRRFERDPHRALDVLQSVWLTAWKTIGTLRQPAAFRTWLYRIAHGLVVTSIREAQRRREVESERSDWPSRPPRSPEQESIDTADLLHFAVEQLSPEHRAVVLLRFLADMNVDEIAEATGVPPGTVKSRLHYAKQTLQKIIEEQNHG